jgi:hypothetical protein
VGNYCRTDNCNDRIMTCHDCHKGAKRQAASSRPRAHTSAPHHCTQGPAQGSEIAVRAVWLFLRVAWSLNREVRALTVSACNLRGCSRHSKQLCACACACVPRAQVYLMASRAMTIMFYLFTPFLTLACGCP